MCSPRRRCSAIPLVRREADPAIRFHSDTDTVVRHARGRQRQRSRFTGCRRSSQNRSSTSRKGIRDGEPASMRSHRTQVRAGRKPKAPACRVPTRFLQPFAGVGYGMGVGIALTPISTETRSVRVKSGSPFWGLPAKDVAPVWNWKTRAA